MGAQGGRCPRGGGRSRCARAAQRRAAAGPRFPAHGRVYRRPGAASGVRAHLSSLLGGPATCRRPGGSASTDTGVVAGVVGPVDVSRWLGRGGRTLADHPEGADVRADGRHRRRTHDLAAGVPGRGSKLGLSLLLAAGQRAPSRRTDGRRVRRRGRQLEGLAAPCGRRRPGRPPDHVRPRRRAAARRVRAGLASGVRELSSRQGRQRRVRPAATGRVRRGHGRDVSGQEAGDASGSARMGASSVRSSSGSSPTGRSRTTVYGRCAAPGATSCTRR